MVTLYWAEINLKRDYNDLITTSRRCSTNYRNGNPVVLDGERVSVSEGGNLVIRDAKAEFDDGGEYVCQAINIVGSRDSEPATLQVQGKKD